MEVVVTKVAYPAAVTAGLCRGGGGAVLEKGVGGVGSSSVQNVPVARVWLVGAELS